MTSPNGTDNSPATPSTEPRDLYLMVLLHLVNGVEAGALSLTVDFGGTMITGTAISHNEWYERWLKLIEGANKEFADGMRDAFASLNELDQDRANDDQPPRPINYLHMRDARLIHGGDTVVHLNLWRGEVDRITGWTIGELGSQR